MRKKSALRAGVLSGLASTEKVFLSGRYKVLESSDLIRLRSDWVRVGADFDTVIQRECDHGQTQGKIDNCGEGVKHGSTSCKAFKQVA